MRFRQEGKRGGGGSSSFKLNLLTPAYLRDAGPAGWVNGFSIFASTMPRDQNRAAEGSILIVKRKYIANLGIVYPQNYN